MNLYRCIVALTLMAAASALIDLRLDLSLTGRCGRRCGLTPVRYVPPRPDSDQCFKVFDFVAADINVNRGLSVSVDIFRFYANSKPAISLDIAIDAFLNLSRGCALILNVWVAKLGGILLELIASVVRLIVCVLGNPWKNGNFISSWLTLSSNSVPAVCKKNFGSRWGWSFLSLVVSLKDFRESYNFVNIEANILSLLKAELNISSVDELTGTYKLIIEIMLRICNLCKRDISVWKRGDFVILVRLMVTISGAILSGHKVEAGYACIDEYSKFLEIVLKKEFNTDGANQWAIAKDDLTRCDTVDFNGALRTHANIDVNN